MTALVTSRSFERSVPFDLTRAAPDEGGDGLTFEGYAAVFNSKTRIDSWEGVFDEQISPGAFRKTIRERTPVLQFDHGRHPLVGSIPIGSIRELGEDERGLFVQARLAANWLIQPVRDAIANGSVDGMSFRFEVVKEEWFDRYGVRLTDEREIFQLLYEPGDRGPLQRTLRELKVPELGPVVFPAYPDTTAGVRSKAIAVARRIEDDDELCRAVRASLVGASRRVDLVAGAEAGEVAAALLFPDRVAPADEEAVERAVEEDNSEGDSVADVAAPDGQRVTLLPDGEIRFFEDDDQENHDTDSERQTDDATVERTEPDEQDEESRSDGQSEAEADTEPVIDHSENRAQDEPDTVHSAPEDPPTFADVRTTPSHLELAEAEERQAARKLAAAQIKARYARATERAHRYSD